MPPGGPPPVIYNEVIDVDASSDLLNVVKFTYNFVISSRLFAPLENTSLGKVRMKFSATPDFHALAIIRQSID